MAESVPLSVDAGAPPTRLEHRPGNFGRDVAPVIDEIGRPKKMTPTASPVRASS